MVYWTILVIVLLAIVIIINLWRINNLKESASYNSEYIRNLHKDLYQTTSELHKYKDEIEKRNSYFCWFMDEYWHNGANDANRAILILRHGLRFFNWDNKPLKDYSNERKYLNHNIYNFEQDITDEITIKWVGGTKGGKSLFGEKAWKLLIEFTPVEIGNLIIDISYLARNDDVKERENIQGCTEAFIQKNPRLKELWTD